MREKCTSLSLVIAFILIGCSNSFKRPDLSISEFKKKYLVEFGDYPVEKIELYQYRAVGGSTYCARLTDVEKIQGEIQDWTRTQKTRDSELIKAHLRVDFDTVFYGVEFPVWASSMKVENFYMLQLDGDILGRRFYVSEIVGEVFMIVSED